MSATIAASVKFWPEIRTVPWSVEADDGLSVADELLSELPQAVRSAAVAATTPAKRRRVCIGFHLLCPASLVNGARVRCPPSRAWSAHHAPTPEVTRRRVGPSVVAVPLRFGSTARSTKALPTSSRNATTATTNAAAIPLG